MPPGVASFFFRLWWRRKIYMKRRLPHCLGYWNGLSCLKAYAMPLLPSNAASTKHCKDLLENVLWHKQMISLSRAKIQETSTGIVWVFLKLCIVVAWAVLVKRRSSISPKFFSLVILSVLIRSCPIPPDYVHRTIPSFHNNTQGFTLVRSCTELFSWPHNTLRFLHACLPPYTAEKASFLYLFTIY